MTKGELIKRLEKYDDNDIIISESRGGKYISPNIYDMGYTDIRNKDSYYDLLEEALAEVPKKFIRKRVMITGNT